ncbi:MAG TPA: hypothetical protein VGM90_39905 [Kofleriaceae bacterium]|jgi:hypothetical protein
MRSALALIAALAGCASMNSGAPPADDAGPGDDASPAQCIDIDHDGVCNAVDICPGADDSVDSDADTIPDGCDDCPGTDDRIDANANNIPDCAEVLTKAIDLKVVGGNYWRGWHSLGAMHTSGNDNTATGDTGGSIYNSYFIFPLAGITASSIQSVTLELELESYVGAATETFSIWDVTSAPSDVENSGDSSVIFPDLQSGTKYGMNTLTAGQVNQVITTPLAAAADVKAHLGQDFAVGVHLDTAAGTYVRFSSGEAGEVRHDRLVITYVP